MTNSTEIVYINDKILEINYNSVDENGSPLIIEINTTTNIIIN